MYQKRHLLHAASLLVAFAGFTAPVHAYEFALGSDGSDGAIVVDTDTEYVLPPDGVIHATTVDIAEGATLTFTRNERNTGVVLLATGAVNIGGTIDVSGTSAVGESGGRGGPGGTNAGSHARFRTQTSIWFALRSSDGERTDRNYVVGGNGGHGSRPDSDAECSGSGGGGGGGGGGILVVSNTEINATSADAVIAARGGSPGPFAICGPLGAERPASGEGGTVHLVAPTLNGEGILVDTRSLSHEGAPFVSGYVSVSYLEGILPETETIGFDVDQLMYRWEPNPIVSAEVISVDGLPYDSDTMDAIELGGGERSVSVQVRVVGCTGDQLDVTINGGSAGSRDGSSFEPTGDDTVTIDTPTLESGALSSFRVEARCDR